MTIINNDIPPVISGHPAHPDHQLNLVTADGRRFICDGCKEPGGGGAARYRCEHELCNFDLHTCCTAAEPTLTHQLFGANTFVFLLDPPAAAGTAGGWAGWRGKKEVDVGRVCDACGDPVRGIVYHCFDGDLDLHPCCARLPERLVQAEGRVFELRRRPSSSSACGMCGGGGKKTTGGRCRRRRDEFWAYRSRLDGGEEMDVHVACMKEMARLSWTADAERQSRAAGGAQIVLAAAGAPGMDRMLQSLPRRTRGASGGFQRFWRIAGPVMSVVIAVIFGNPVAMMAAIAGPGGLLRD